MKQVMHAAQEAKWLLSQHKPLIVYDVETTGLNASNDRIIQFSGIYLEWKTEKNEYQIVQNFEQYIKPPFPVSSLIEELTGITNERLANEPSEDEAFKRIFRFLCRDVVFIGYNNRFDDKMINAMSMRQVHKQFLPVKRIDVFTIAKELVRKNDLPDGHYKLCSMAEYYKVTVPGFHNASVDILNTWYVLLAEMRDLDARLEDISENEPQTVPFKLTSMSRWKKSYGRDRRYDRIYASTNIGDFVYDLIESTVKAKDGSDKNIEPEELINQMNLLAVANGYASYREVDRRIP